jgi:hypothetical protein
MQLDQWVDPPPPITSSTHSPPSKSDQAAGRKGCGRDLSEGQHTRRVEGIDASSVQESANVNHIWLSLHPHAIALFAVRNLPSSGTERERERKGEEPQAWVQ